jgi:hypothetical protein
MTRLREDEETRRRLVAAAVSEDMLGRPFSDPDASDDSFHIFPALEVKKRLNTRHKFSQSHLKCLHRRNIPWF